MQTKLNNSYFHSFWVPPFCHLLLPPPFHLLSHDFRLLRSFHGLRMLINRILYVYARGTLIPALACISGDKCLASHNACVGFLTWSLSSLCSSLPYSPSWFVINGGPQRQEGGDSAAVLGLAYVFSNNAEAGVGGWQWIGGSSSFFVLWHNQNRGKEASCCRWHNQNRGTRADCCGWVAATYAGNRLCNGQMCSWVVLSNMKKIKLVGYIK